MFSSSSPWILEKAMKLDQEVEYCSQFGWCHVEELVY